MIRALFLACLTALIGAGVCAGPIPSYPPVTTPLTGNEQVVVAQSGVTKIVTTGQLGVTGAIPANQSFTGTFWNPKAKQNRLADRVFCGAAVVNDGTNATPNADWLGIFNQTEGWTGANDVNDATLGCLVDPNSAAATSNGPVIGILSAVQTPSNASAASPRAIEGLAYLNAPQDATFTLAISTTTLTASAVTGSIKVGDLIYGTGVSTQPPTLIVAQLTGPTGGAGTYTVTVSQTVGSTSGRATRATSLWTNYNECFLMGPGGYGAYCTEADGANYIGANNLVDPYTLHTPYVSIYAFRCGGGRGNVPSLQYPCTDAWDVAANGQAFAAGGVFFTGSIAPVGPGASITSPATISDGSGGAGTILDVSAAVVTGTLRGGDVITGTGVAAGTTLVRQNDPTGLKWTVSISQHITGQALTTNSERALSFARGQAAQWYGASDTLDADMTSDAFGSLHIWSQGFTELDGAGLVVNGPAQVGGQVTGSSSSVPGLVETVIANTSGSVDGLLLHGVVTNTACSGCNLIDLIVGVTPEFQVNVFGDATATGRLTGNTVAAVGELFPGTGAATQTAGGLLAGTGNPGAGVGGNGDFYFRTDCTHGSSDCTWHKEGGTWFDLN